MHAEVETNAQRIESGNDSTEEIMELEEFQAENDGADEQKEEEEIEEERDERVEDEKDFEMEDENGEDDKNIRKKEEKLVEFIESSDDSEEEGKTTEGLPKMRTSPQKSTVSPRKISSSPQEIKGSPQKVSSSFSRDVVERSQKTPENLALSPSSSLSMEDSDKEEFEGKTMMPQRTTTASQKRNNSPHTITLSPSSSSSMENSEEDTEDKELEADREKLTAGKEVVETSAKELPEEVNKEPGMTKNKYLKKSTLIEVSSEASTYSLVLEESEDEEESEKLVNQVLEFIDHSNASEKDLFEELDGICCEISNQQKVVTSFNNYQ